MEVLFDEGALAHNGAARLTKPLNELKNGAGGDSCCEAGLPLSYPGGPQLIFEMVDVDLLARSMEWAAATPACRNETFNITNGDVFVWEGVWPTIADALGMQAGAPEPMSLAAEMPKHAAEWAKIVPVRDALRPPCGDLSAYGEPPFSNYPALAIADRGREVADLAHARSPRSCPYRKFISENNGGGVRRELAAIRPSRSVVIGVSTSNRSTAGVQKPKKRSKSLTAASCQDSSFPFLISA